MRRHIAAVLLTFCGVTAALAEWTPDSDDELQQAAYRSVGDFRLQRSDELQRFFDEYYAIAVFPAVRRGALLFGWAGGMGVLLEGDEYVGRVRQRRFSLGAQVGYQTRAQIMFFRDAETVAQFKKGVLEFAPQSSATVGGHGNAADAGFNPRVAVFSLAEGGLMVELSAGATSYKFVPASR